MIVKFRRRNTRYPDLSDETTPHPWMPFAGIWKDHPEIDAWQDTIAEHRAQLDKAESDGVLDTDTPGSH